MTQVNLLAIDLSKSTESNGSQGSSSEVANDGSTRFSDVMAQHQQNESGNNSQQSGKQSADKNDAIQQKGDPHTSTNQSKEASNEGEAANAEHEDKQVAATSESKSEKSIEGTPDKSTETGDKIKVQITPVEPEVSATVAEELLSFIMASSDTSTEKTTVENTGTEKPSVDKVIKNIDQPSIVLDKDKKQFAGIESASDASVNSAPTGNEIPTVAKDGKGQSAELPKVSKEVDGKSDVAKVEAATVKQTENNDVKQPIDTKDLVKEDKSTNQVNREVELVKSKNTEVLAQTAEVKPQDSEQKVVEDVANKRPSIEVQADESSDEMVRIVASEVLKSTETSSDEVKPVETKTTDKVTAAPQAQTSHKEEMVSNGVVKVEQQVDPSPDRVNVSEQKVVENKVTNVVEERVINKSTQSVVAQQASSQQQQSNTSEHSHQQEAKSQVVEEVIVRDKQQLVSDKVLNTTIDEKANQSVTNSNNHQPFTPQAISHAEEQVLQQVMAKANADSMSVQSAKTAINIQNETISIYRKDFSTAVKDKVMVMINQKIKQLEIRLDPPELGSMQVKLNMQNEQAVVNIVVQNQQAKDALEQNMSKLKDMLSESGVDVGDANVEQHNQQASEDGEFDQQSGRGDLSDGLLEQQVALAGNELFKASATGVDYYA